MKIKLMTIAVFLIFISSSLVSANNVNQINITEDPNWEQINEDGFGTTNNYEPRGITIFNGTLLIGTDNLVDFWTQTYSKMPLWKSIKLYFKYIRNEGIKSDGCQIWAYDGNDLKQVVGNSSEAVMESGFGNKNNYCVGVLIQYKEYLYACLYNQEEGCQIWRTRDLNETWEIVAKDGLGNLNNTEIISAKVFNGSLYIGTINWFDGCEVFRTDDGVNWEAVVGGTAKAKSGFGTSQTWASSMCIYNSYLYLGTHPGDLWKTIDGKNWTPVISFENHVCPKGYKKNKLIGLYELRNMVVYKDELYFGFKDLKWHRYNFLIQKIKFMNPFNFLGPIGPLFGGLEIWKYNLSKDECTRVVGGIFKGNSSGGFNDIWNQFPWTMLVHNGYIYVGTMRIVPTNISLSLSRNGYLLPHMFVKIGRPAGGAELWRFDGNEWQMIMENGFGNPYNLGIRSLIFYNNSFITGTSNLVNGCELWRVNC